MTGGPLANLDTATVRQRLDAVMAERQRLYDAGAGASDFDGPNAARDALVSELYRRGCEMDGPAMGLAMLDKEERRGRA